MEKKPFELKVNAYRDREAIVTALVNAGYVVSVEEREKEHRVGSDFYVIIGRKENVDSEK
ncbi:MAG: hypothetical protein ABFD59_08235 [Smithella sp.]